MGNASDPELIDLDSDGDVDAIVGRSTFDLRYFRNTGSSAAAAFVEVTGFARPLWELPHITGMSPELVDLSGDGNLDIVLGDQSGTLNYFVATGSSLTPAFVRDNLLGIDTGRNGYSSVALGDLDDDGDLDAVVGGEDGTLRWIWNPGSTPLAAWVEATGTANPLNGIDVVYDSAPALADVDGDGDLDAVVGAMSGLTFCRNTGSPAVPAFVVVASSANPFEFGGTQRAPELVDLDDDGDLDAVVGKADGQVDYFVNTGSSTAPAYAQATGSANPFDGIDVGQNSSPALVDFDGDGDLDAAVGEIFGDVYYFVNTGSASAPAYSQATGTDYPFNDVFATRNSKPELADLEGDGDLDVLLGQRFGRLILYRSLAADIFHDDFETGDTSRWSFASPP